MIGFGSTLSILSKDLDLLNKDGVMLGNNPLRTEDTFVLYHSLLFTKSSEIPHENLRKNIF